MKAETKDPWNELRDQRFMEADRALYAGTFFSFRTNVIYSEVREKSLAAQQRANRSTRTRGKMVNCVLENCVLRSGNLINSARDLIIADQIPEGNN